MTSTILMYVGIGVAALLTIILFFGSFFTVRTQKLAVIERFGKFIKLAKPGLNFKAPIIDKIVARLTLKVQELVIKVETKTKDNVFVVVAVSVQYFILEAKAYEAYYKLSDPTGQITSYVFDVVRATVPKTDLDDVFAKKDDIADAVKKELATTMDDFGYSIMKALVVDIEPDKNVKAAMNEINASQRMRVAATEKGEADRILKVKAAEAEAQSKALQGEGIANQRKAIVAGLKESVVDFQSAVGGATANDVMQLVMLTQYFDTIKEVGTGSNSTTIMLPHSPGGLSDIGDQIRNAMITAGQIKK